MRNEASTRSQLIDTQLARASWSVGSRRVVEEFLLQPSPSLSEPIDPALGSPELADYVLLDRLEISKLPSREESISAAFDEWVRQHPELGATQLMFVRTLRKAVMQKAAIASVDSLRQPPFTTIGDPEKLFPPAVLHDMLDLTRQLAA